MNKFYGNVGYITMDEVAPGVHRPREQVLPYYGEWTRFKSLFQVSPDSTNDDTNVDCELSIMADPFAFQHFSDLRFVEHMGVRWKVKSAVPQRPRILLSIGGLWHSEQANVADEA